MIGVWVVGGAVFVDEVWVALLVVVCMCMCMCVCMCIC
jgi:hypothetical protein